MGRGGEREKGMEDTFWLKRKLSLPPQKERKKERKEDETFISIATVKNSLRHFTQDYVSFYSSKAKLISVVKL